MSAFRDEHAALLERVASLEQELQSARVSEPRRDEIATQLQALAERVAAATRQADADHAALVEIGAALDRMRGTVSPPEAAPVVARPPAAPPRPPLPMALLLAPFIVVFLVVLGGGIVSRLGSRSKTAGESERVATPLNATELLPRARAAAPVGAELVRITVRDASSDGLVHQAPSYTGGVEFTFVSSQAPLVKPSAPGVPPPLEISDEATVTFTPEGRPTSNVQHFTMPIRFSGSVPDPRCTVAQIWAAARAAGAPPEAVATIEYADSLPVGLEPDARKPRWTFEILGTRFKRFIPDECAADLR